MANIHLIIYFSLLLVLLLISKTSAKIPAVIVFGDSSVDAGNNNVISTVLKSNFRPYGRDFNGGRPTGRFSNGRIPPDFISQAFGLKPAVPAYLDPSFTIADFATGVCFASAGTGYDNATSNVLNVIPLWKELEYFQDYQKKLRDFVGEDKAKEIVGEALYLMSLGTNDFLENYYTFPMRRSQFTVKQYEDFLVRLAGKFITELYNMGARKLSLTGVPPMGCLPLERTTNLMSHDCSPEYNNVAFEFNGKLQALASQLNKELPGFQILFTSSVFDLFYDIIRRPSLYGFEVTGVACCATGTFEMSYLCNEHSITCPDANKYVFWDAFHPTERTNQIISQHLIPILLSEFH
ncbi:GDSL-like Lipase/Acylhydrolase superfamily protein [Euphorbia peplus]|nr:GDSL-like Lipase/Acylhydrolase superfamily protein [Euphorbia peplus]